MRPAIEEQFRCNGETAIVGESLAGLFVVETLVVDPDLFGRYIAFDPSLWWNDSQLAAAAESPGMSKLRAGKQLWLASSSAEGMKKRSSQLAKVLSLDPDNPMVLSYQHCPNEEHSTIFRAKKREAFGVALWKD